MTDRQRDAQFEADMDEFAKETEEVEATTPAVTVERMAYDKVWEAKDLLIDAYNAATNTRAERTEVKRIISQAQRLLTEAKALLP